MPHIAIVTSLLTGRINSTFELASRLQKEGHTITYLCQPSSQEKIEENGFTCVPVPAITFDYTYPKRSRMESSWFKKFIFHYKNLKSHYDEGLRILNLEEHKMRLKQVDPDLILVDTEIHDLIFTAWELKIPIKLLTTWFSDTISLKSPSVRTGIIPGVGFSGSKIGIFWSWMIMRLKINGRVLINRLKFEHYRRWMLKTYARKIGFNTEELLANTLPPLFSFKELPIVTLAMSELEFPHKLAKNIIYAGPMVFEDRMDKSIILEDEQKLNKIYEDRLATNKKLIYCEVGSLAKGHLPFLNKVIEAVANEKDWIMILSIGPKMTANSFLSVPENVHLFNWVPQLSVIEQSDCCITHCGINGINECLHFKVPMLLYSCKLTDGDGNAAKMSYHGLGIRGDILTDSSALIKENIEQVLTDEVFKVNMRKYHGIYLAYKARPLTPLLFNF